MDLGLKDKVVLITGGSKGSASPVPVAFAMEGARVAIVSRDPANLARAREQLANEGLHVHLARADLSEPHSAADVVEEATTALGPIDILINSAGAGPPLRAGSTGRSRLPGHDGREIFPVYQSATRSVATHGRAHQGGWGLGTGDDRQHHRHGRQDRERYPYRRGGANAALMLATGRPCALLRTLWHPDQRDQSRRDANRPRRGSGRAGSEAARRRHERGGWRVAKRRCRSGATRRGREEIADVALFLASGRASYVTGAIVPMDGCGAPVI